MGKREFLVVYDYGGGGLWGVVVAHDESELHRLYPELVIAQPPPGWMTPERFEEIRNREWHDIDGAPWGLLNVVLDDRRRRLEDPDS